MNREEIKATVLRALSAVAPEADLSCLAPGADVRDALDIDSMDFLKFVVGVHDALHVDIPERDYPKVRTLEDCTTYVAARLGCAP